MQAATYQIQFNLNGGSGSTSPLTCTVGQTCDLYGYSYGTLWIYRPGYVLIGWSTTPSNPETAKWTVSYSSPGSYTYYAVWEECPAGTYKDTTWHAIDSCQSCPALTPGFEYDTKVGMSSYTECKQGTFEPSVANPYCESSLEAGQVGRFSVIIQTAGSPNSWDGSTDVQSVAAAPGAILDSRFQGNSLHVQGAYDLNDMCTLCGAGEYSPGGDITECISCPALTPGFEYASPKPGASYKDCMQIALLPEAANEYCTTNTGGNIRQQTTDGVNWNVLLANGVIAKPGAYIDPVVIEVPGDDILFKEGVYDLSNLCRVCPGNSYSLGGEEAVCTACLDNYTTTGDALTDHDSASDCKIYCDGGSYISVANATQCSNVGAGYWAPSSTIPQGSVGSRTACASGLTTIGSGAGADEAGDCGRVLNVGDEKIYLRSTKKTTPSLNISINGDVFYGNMSTATKGSLRINSGGTTYSVYDDSM